MESFGEEDVAEWKKAPQRSNMDTEDGAYFVELTVLTVLLRETEKREFRPL